MAVVYTLTIPFKVGYHILGLVDVSGGQRRPLGSTLRLPRVSTVTEEDDVIGEQSHHADEPEINQISVGSEHDCTENTPLIPHRPSSFTSQEEEDGSFKQDGYISALILFCMMISTSFSVTMTMWAGKMSPITELSPVVPLHHAHFLLVVYMFISVVIMWFFITQRYKTKVARYIIGSLYDNRLVSSVQYATIRAQMLRTLQSSIPLVGLMVFFTLACFYDLFGIVNDMTCQSAMLECHGTFAYATTLMYEILKLIFMASLLLFCFTFQSNVFRQTTTMRYILVAILGSTVSVWFNELLSDLYGLTITSTNSSNTSSLTFNVTIECPNINKMSDWSIFTSEQYALSAREHGSRHHIPQYKTVLYVSPCRIQPTNRRYGLPHVQTSDGPHENHRRRPARHIRQLRRWEQPEPEPVDASTRGTWTPRGDHRREGGVLTPV